MDLMAILSLISLANGIIQTAKSNEEIADKIQHIAAPLVPALVALAHQLFPGVNTPVAAGAVAMDPVTVKHIQSALNTKTGSTLTVDGYYGRNTTAAVKAYQTANNLTVDGFCGKLTQALLFS